MLYRLKKGQENFQVVDGPFAYHTYRHGETYDTVPPEEAHKFDELGAGAKDQGTGKTVRAKNLSPQPRNENGDGLISGPGTTDDEKNVN